MRIFVSYRRDDASHQAGRLCDRLVSHFGRANVFQDVNTIPVGKDFRQVIQSEVEKADVLLAIIGEHWLSAKSEAGTRRLDDPEDFVRHEIVTALAAGVTVVPVLFDEAQMPAADDLPEPLAQLAFRNGVRIQPDPSFHDDVDRLIEQLQSAPATAAASSTDASAPAVSRRALVWVLGCFMIALAIAIGVWMLFQKPDTIGQMRRAEIDREVESVRSEPQLIYRTHPDDLRKVDSVEVPNNAGFEVRSDRMIVDLRGWKDVPPDKLGELVSAVTVKRRVDLKKIAPADAFRVQGRTSGLELFWRCLDPFPMSVDAQRTQSFVGAERMKIRLMSIDVSTVPVGQEFSLRYAGTYWNSLQTEQEQWFGVIGYKQSFLASILILFPPEKPFKSYSLSVAQTSKDTPRPYDGPKIVLASPQKDWVYWEVPTPAEGHVYRLGWTW